MPHPLSSCRSAVLSVELRVFVLILSLFTSALIVTTPLYAAGTINIVPGNANGASDIYGDEYIRTQLNSGDFPLNTDSAGSGPSDIHIAPGVVITWTSGFSLTLVADGNIVVSGTIQHNGPINGSGGLLLQADADDTDGGDVLLGLGTQPNAIEVGSRYGLTRVDGSSVRLQAANSGDGLHTQLGYYDINPLTAISTTGPISVSASLTVSALGGGGQFSYAQIGHGGVTNFITSMGAFFGDINIYSAGDIVFIGGGNEIAYAQIGNGAAFGDGDYGGSHTLFATHNITFTGGTGGQAYAQVGNGGLVTGGSRVSDESGNHRLVAQNGNIAFTAGVGGSSSALVGNGGTEGILNASGDLSLLAGQDILFVNGNDTYGFAQVGNGANSDGGSIRGDLSVIAGRNIVFDGTSPNNGSYVQIGHGGENFQIDASDPQTITGDIKVIAQTGYISFTGGSIDRAYAQVGHRVREGSIDGSIVVTAAKSIYFAAGSGEDSYTQLGHSSTAGAEGGNRNGSITVNAGEDITFLAGAEDAYALVGHGTYGNDWFLSGDISLTTGGDATFTAGYGEDAFVQVGHSSFEGGDHPSGNVSILAPDGDILFTGGSADVTYALAGLGGRSFYTLGGTSEHNLLAGGKVVFAAGSGVDSFAQVGNTGSSAVGIFNNLTITTLSGAISFLAGTGDYEAYAMAGNGGADFITSPLLGNVILNSATDVIFTAAGSLDSSFVMAGNGGMSPQAPITGSVVITAGGSISFTAGNGEYSFAQVGNGGYEYAYNYVGDHRLTAGANIAFRAGNGNGAYAMVGNGGYSAYELQTTDGNHSGSHQLTAGGGISFIAANSIDAFVQVGNGGTLTTGNHSGDMSVTAGSGDVVFTAGNNLRTYAQLGNGGASASGDHTGDITVTSAQGDIRVTSGNSSSTYAQIGNGGYAANGQHDGDLTIEAPNGNVVFLAQTGSQAYVMAGNGGYSASGGGPGDFGDLTVEAGGAITFTGGAGSFAFAQIGNGGALTAGNHTGQITVTAGSGDVVFTTGTQLQTYAQIGNGGRLSDGDHSGDITVTSAQGDIRFTGGNSSDTYAQIGNGGHSVDGTHEGDLTVKAPNGDIVFLAQAGAEAYVMIGNGGCQTEDGVPGNFGDLAVEAGGSITFTAGGAIYAFAQIGNGGALSAGSHSGQITVTAGSGDVVFTTGTQLRTYAQIGNGGDGADGNHTGDITVTSAQGDIRFTGGNTTYTYAQIGNGGHGANGQHDGKLKVEAPNGDIVFLAQVSPEAYVMVGNGGFDTDVTGSNDFGDLTVAAGGSITFTAGGGNNAYAQIGNGGTLSSGNHSGQITVTAGSGDVVFTTGTGLFAYAQIGNGGSLVDGNHSGDISVTSTQGDIRFTGGNTNYTYAQIGNGGYFAAGQHDGNLKVKAPNGDVVFLTQASPQAYVMVGNGGYSTDATGSDDFGDLTVEAGGSITFTAGGAIYAFAQIGNGGALTTGNHSGQITVTAGSGDVVFTAGTQTNTYAQIGNGGLLTSGNHTGDITVTSAQGDIRFTGGNTVNSYAQVGNGGFYTAGQHDGNLKVKAPNGDVVFLAGVSPITYVMVGNGGFDTDATGSDDFGDLTVEAGGSITFTAGGGNYAFAQIGNGGALTSGNHSGQITVAAGSGDVVFTTGTGLYTYAHIGNGGDNTTGNHSGDITIISAQGDIRFTGGNTVNSYAQVGNGGFYASGQHDGDLTVKAPNGDIVFLARVSPQAYVMVGNGGYGTGATGSDDFGDLTVEAGGSITFTAGGSDYAFAQIGNGGALTGGNHSGNISVTAEIGDVVFTAGSVPLAYAQIGHGDGATNSSGTRSGDIVVLTGDDLVLTGSRIGHVTLDGVNAITNANTYIGVGQNDLSLLGNGLINATNTTTFTVGFNSAPLDNDGELRFYVPRPDSVFIPANTPMNSELFPGTIPANRMVGYALFADGPYIEDYSFYVAVPSDLGVSKQAAPSGALLPGQPLTYTLAFSNSGLYTATNVVLTDTLAAELTNVTLDSTLDSGVTITQTGSAPNLAWTMSDLAPGAEGTIFIHALVTGQITTPVAFANRAAITGTLDITPTNNSALVNSSITLPLVGFVPSSYSVLEYDGSVALNIALSVPNPYTPTLVNVSTTDISASAASDYVAQSGALTIPAGQSSVTLTVPITDDNTLETDELFSVTLTSGVGVGNAANMQADVTILDDDNSKLSITALDADKTEGNSGATAFTFMVSRIDGMNNTVTVDYATSGNINAADFVGNALPSGTLTFNTGDSSQIITATVQGDTVLEADEPFTITLSNTSANAAITGATATGSINNDDSASLSIDDVSSPEGNSGTALVTLTVTLSGTTNLSFTVDFATADGSATAGNDYTAQSNALNFTGNNGETKSIAVQVAGDSALEADETLTVGLSNVQGLPISLADSSGQVTIANDDSELAISVLDADKAEGNSGTTPFTFAVNRTGYLSSTVSVDFATSGDANGADFDGNALPSGTLTFNSGESSQIITATVVGDSILEADEPFMVTLSNGSANATITSNTAAGSLDNDDSASLSIDDVSGFEGNSGTTLVTLTVILSGTTDTPFTVDFATDDGSATAGSDYTAQANTLTFVGNDDETQSIAVQVAGDSSLEADEILTVALSNVLGLPVTLADESGQITMVNDDSQLSIAALDADKTEGNSGTTSFTFVVNRTGYLSSTTTVDFATSGAANGVDFVGNALSSGSVTFNSGASSQVVTATVQGDLLAETDENFTVTLSNASAGASIATAAAAGTIRNDDILPALTVSKVASVSLARVGEVITYTYRITNSGGVTFTALSAVDDLLGAVTLDKSSLALGEVATGQLAYTVASSDLNGPLVNTVTVTGTPVVGNDVVVTADASVDLVFAAFSFAKTVGIEGITPECSNTGTMQVPISTTIVYCFTLTNTGAIPLTTHTLEDSQLGTVLDGVTFDVAPGASFSTTVTRTIYASVTNTAVWQAGYAGSEAQADTVSIAALPVLNNAQATINISDADDDQDGDGIFDNTELAGDLDDDNKPNFLDDDSDGDGRLDSTECSALPCRDSNGDGVPDFLDPNDATGLDPDAQPLSPGEIFLPQIGHES